MDFSGVIKSYSQHTYRVNDISYRFTVDQTINYNECQARPLEGADNVRLHVARTFLIYSETEQIVRYAATHRVTSGGGGRCQIDKTICYESYLIIDTLRIFFPQWVVDSLSACTQSSFKDSSI